MTYELSSDYFFCTVEVLYNVQYIKHIFFLIFSFAGSGETSAYIISLILYFVIDFWMGPRGLEFTNGQMIWMAVLSLMFFFDSFRLMASLC
jgi:hypothetical protein